MANSNPVPEPGPFLYYVKKNENAYDPVKVEPFGPGFVLRSSYDYLIPPHKVVVVKTELQIAVPEGTYGRIAIINELAVDHSIDVAGSIIDQTYWQHLGIPLINHSDKNFRVSTGDRVAQLICEKFMDPEVKQVQELKDYGDGDYVFGTRIHSKPIGKIRYKGDISGDELEPVEPEDYDSEYEGEGEFEDEDEIDLSELVTIKKKIFEIKEVKPKEENKFEEEFEVQEDKLKENKLEEKDETKNVNLKEYSKLTDGERMEEDKVVEKIVKNTDSPKLKTDLPKAKTDLPKAKTDLPKSEKNLPESKEGSPESKRFRAGE